MYPVQHLTEHCYNDNGRRSAYRWLAFSSFAPTKSNCPFVTVLNVQGNIIKR
jgi:hypothetical protein